MSLSLLLLLITLSLLSTTPLSLSSTTNPPDRFIKSIPPHQSLRHSKPQEYIELTHPLPSDHLIPSFSLQILHHYFADTIGRPPISAPYSPPSACPPPSSSTSKPPPTATSTTASPQSGSPAPRSSAPAPPNPPPTASSGMSIRTSPGMSRCSNGRISL
ncbi:hypothetical protein LOK49_LG14G02270 [Camellia lanceoleosa]|uniref:Uncharacterized protein n=1 Tax=Camellia lanceoleosa TaxID=1840588 RepID=A0ACC0FDB0_9ERIC|nr:hypothetical protein LOK49_LG14G02270 [Camellia lanceoleosa]